MMNWKRGKEMEEKGGGVAYSSYYPYICPEGLKKIMKIHMPWVFYTRPSGLYHAARGHIYKLCMYYKNDTII